MWSITYCMHVSDVSAISAVSEIPQNFKMDVTRGDFWPWHLELSVLKMDIGILKPHA